MNVGGNMLAGKMRRRDVNSRDENRNGNNLCRN